MELQQHDFTIEHRAGKANANADALSRMYDPEPVICYMMKTEEESTNKRSREEIDNDHDADEEDNKEEKDEVAQEPTPYPAMGILFVTVNTRIIHHGTNTKKIGRYHKEKKYALKKILASQA